MNASKPVLVSVIIATMIILAFVAFNATASVTAGKYDGFAKCMSDKGVKMYGAYWCPHCNEQKQMFGSSWKYINYIECSLPNRGGQTQDCNQAGIQAYPAWEFQDGKRAVGSLAPSDLSKFSGCEL